MVSEATKKQEAIQEFIAAMESFDYEDFMESDDPYELFDKASVTPDARARFELILKRRAKELRIPARTIDAILKARNGNIVPLKTSSESMTDWEGQPVMLRTGKYCMDDERITYEDKFGTELVCCHPIMPSRRYINIETGTEAIEISFKREYWKSIVIDKGTLSSASTVIQLANHGVSVTSETSREMVKYLSYIDDLNRDLIPIEQMSNHLGWINDKDFVPYVEGVKYDSQGQFTQMYKTICEHGSYQKWLDALCDVRKNGTPQARITIAASFASVLLSYFDALPFFVHLWSSQSGTGKTVTMELAASVWANPQVGAYCRPLKSTAVGLEQLAIFTCNMPLCLDELQSIQDKRNFDDIIYGLCEGSGKTRGARNGGLRHSPLWKNAIITTGEMPIVGSMSKAGAMNRVIEIECDGPVMENAKDVHRIISANYGFAGRMFVTALCDKEIMQSIEIEQQQLFEMLAATGTDKQSLSASILLAADHAAESIIFHDGIKLTVDDIMPYLRTHDDVDTGKRAHEYLIEWIAENRAGFIVNGDMDTFKNRTLLGCLDADKDGTVESVWIINKAFLSAMIDGGFSPDSYLSWAKGQKLIRCKGSDKKVVKRIPGIGMTARCVCLDFKSHDSEYEQLGFTLTGIDEDIPF